MTGGMLDSQNSTNTTSQRDAAKEEFDQAKPREEELSSDARNQSNGAESADYGPNRRSEAFKKGEDVAADFGKENYANDEVSALK